MQPIGLYSMPEEYCDQIVQWVPMMANLPLGYTFRKNKDKEQVVNTILRPWTLIVLQFSWDIRQQRYTEGLIALREQKWIFIGVASHVHVWNYLCTHTYQAS